VSNSSRGLANLKPWRPGQSGNPSGLPGIGSALYEAQKLAREAAPDSIRKLELRDTCDDPRVVAVCCQALLDRGLGKPKEVPLEPAKPVYDISRTLNDREQKQLYELLKKVAATPRQEG
jgi:hypothetical protein